MSELLYFAYCKYSCGCVETIEVPEKEAGTFKDLPVKCPRCRSNEQASEEISNKIRRKKEIVDSAIELTTANLTKKSDYVPKVLSGKTEKSIQYAQSLRNKFINKWTLNGKISEKAVEILENETKDAFWLENKDELTSVSLLENYKYVDMSFLSKHTLKGSDAQVKWGDTIRENFWKQFCELDAAKEMIQNELKAKFWIDNRENIFLKEWIEEEYIPTDTLPKLELKGTAKEIKKAKAIIKKFVELSSKFLDETQKEKANEFIVKQTNSSWWIENSEKLFNQDFINKATIAKEQYEREKSMLEEYRRKRDIEIAIFPSSGVKRKNTYVRIYDEKDSMIVEAYDNFDNDLKLLLKKNMVYNDGKQWKRNLDDRLTGSYLDRAVELGIKLLEQGYTVCAYSQVVRKNILKGSYVPEKVKWVINIDDGRMAFLAREQSMITKEIISLPDATYDQTIKGVTVPYNTATIQKVISVAQQQGFQLHDVVKVKAGKLLKQATVQK